MSTQSAKNLSTLKPWKKGQSGNPHGRPKKGYSITETFRQLLEGKPEIRKQLAQSILNKALIGDVAAQKLIWQYMDGMPKQEIDATINNSSFTEQQANRIAERIVRRQSSNGDSPSK